MKKVTIILTSICLAAMSGISSAATIRCDGRLIEDDQIEPMNAEQVMKLCGKPDSKEGARWIYNQQKKILVFNSDGKLMNIHNIEPNVEDSVD